MLFSTPQRCIMGLSFDGQDKLYGTEFCNVSSSPFFAIDLAHNAISTVGMTGVPSLHGGDIAVVPEPRTWAMLLAGLLEFIARSRKQRAA